MKNVITYLKTLWRRGLGSQSSDISLDCRLTVGSPSVKYHLNLLRLVAISAFLLTIGVGTVWGTVDATYTLSTSDNNKSNISVGSTTWAVGASAIEASSSNCKITGTISVTLPTGAVLKSVTLTKSNNWGSGAKVIFKAGSTSLNEFTAEGTFTLTSNKTNGSYSFTKGGTATKNAWVKSIMVTYYPQTTITLNANGGAANKTAKYNYNSGTKAAFEACTRDGYTCTGYWTASSGGTKILNTDGTLAAASITVSSVPYTDSNTKWAYDGATLTLYAQWTAAASCSENPSIGTASLNGSISLSSFPVQTTGWTVGANCAWSDFGFVWSSSVSTPTLESNGTASSGCTKIQKATDGTSTSTSHSITGTFNTSTSYYVRGYGKNGYASGSYQYTDVLTITPRSVEFNSNGGSAVDTKYVNSGTKVTAPSDPTKTGYNFGEWQLNSSEFDFANTNVTSNITLVATWTAKTTTVSFNQNSGTGGQTGTLTATYDAAMPSAPVTCPTRTGYDFGGYYDGSGGTGTQYYTNTGASARNWDKENSTWTLYAKWTIKNYTVTWKVNNTDYTTGGPTDNVNHGSSVSKLPTAPDPDDYCGEKFVGWTDADGGVYTHGTSNLYTKASDFPNATGNQIFYAVFADYDE